MIKKDTRVAVLGAGAMGCLFGGLLAEKGLEVVLIDVWKEHVDEINKKGLKMMGHGGDRIVKIKATTEPKKLGKYDAIIIMCKATALENALSNVKNIIVALKKLFINRHLVSNIIKIARAMAVLTLHGRQ